MSSDTIPPPHSPPKDDYSWYVEVDSGICLRCGNDRPTIALSGRRPDLRICEPCAWRAYHNIHHDPQVSSVRIRRRAFQFLGASSAVVGLLGIAEGVGMGRLHAPESMNIAFLGMFMLMLGLGIIGRSPQ